MYDLYVDSKFIGRYETRSEALDTYWEIIEDIAWDNFEMVAMYSQMLAEDKVDEYHDRIEYVKE